MPSQAFFVLLQVLTESVMIRPVKPEDATDIANIYNEYVLHSVATFETEAVSVPEMRGRIERFSAQFPYFVFEDGNHVAGYAYAHLSPNVGNDGLCIRPTRGKRHRHTTHVTAHPVMPRGRMPRAHSLHHPRKCRKPPAAPETWIPAGVAF